MSDLRNVLLLVGGLHIGYALGARRWVIGVVGIILILGWLFADFLAYLADSTDISIF